VEPAAPDGLDRVFPARSAAVATARTAVVEFAARSVGDRARLEAIGVAVSEAVTNAVVHAYPDAHLHPDREPEVRVTARLAGGELWVLVADQGCGFQTRSRNPGLGWGLPLIADACDVVTIAELSDGGTEVRMQFRIAPPAAPLGS